MNLETPRLAIHADAPGNDKTVNKSGCADDHNLRKGREDGPKPLPPIGCSLDSDFIGCVEDSEKVATTRRVMTVGAAVADGAKVIRSSCAEDIDLRAVGVNLWHETSGEIFKMRPIHGWWQSLPYVHATLKNEAVRDADSPNPRRAPHRARGLWRGIDQISSDGIRVLAGM